MYINAKPKQNFFPPTAWILKRCFPRSLRNWLRLPRQSCRLIGEEIKHSVGANEVIQLRPSWFLRCHPTAYRVGRQSWIEDKEQAQEFSNFISYCQPGMVFFDVGAHFGFFSFAALHYGGIDAKAVAIDPSPVSKRMMKILATLNNFAGRLCLIHASASDHVGEKPMVATGVITDGYFVEPFQSHTATDITLTPTITLDTLSEELKVVPTHIKIDVEGQELSVLRGAKKVLSQSQPPLLFLELHNQIIRDRGGDPSEPLSLLKDFGYDLFDAQGNALDDPEILRCNLIRIMARSSANR